MYKTQTPNEETQGAPEVKEAPDVHVEVPVDQVGGGPRRTVPTSFSLLLRQPCLRLIPSPSPELSLASRMFFVPCS